MVSHSLPAPSYSSPRLLQTYSLPCSLHPWGRCTEVPLLARSLGCQPKPIGEDRFCIEAKQLFFFFPLLLRPERVFTVWEVERRLGRRLVSGAWRLLFLILEALRERLTPKMGWHFLWCRKQRGSHPWGRKKTFSQLYHRSSRAFKPHQRIISKSWFVCQWS